MNESMPSRVHPVHAAQKPVICSDVSFVHRPDFDDTGSNPHLLRPSRTKPTHLKFRRSGQSRHREPSERSVVQQQTKLKHFLKSYKGEKGPPPAGLSESVYPILNSVFVRS